MFLLFKQFLFLYFCLLKWCSLLNVEALIQGDSFQGRYAYVTVHYEGTSRDEEYVLGVQILMHSIKMTGTKHDLVVLASESVSKESKEIFRSIGCKIIDVKNIENPFLGGTLRNKNFIYTLNKLHVWNLLDYDRVVYLDADNVLIRNADELFLCGDFCAVFMNPCHFHTGLLVIKPDQKEYERLLNSLDHLESFDGADQGFLSSMYSEILRKSQLFIPSKARKMQQKKLPKAMRLSVGYNINHKYFYEQYHWKLFFLRHFASLTSAVSPVSVVVESARPIPALTLGFPMAPILKPWYWWACFFMDLHHVWHDIRATLPFEQERFGLEQSMKTLSRFGLTLFLCSIIFLFVKKHIPIGTIREFCVHANIQNNYYTKKAFLIFRILLVLLAIRVSPTWIHRLAPIQYAFSLYIFIHVTWLVFFACCISSFWQYSQQTWLPPLVQYMEFWIYVCLTLLIDWIVLWSSTWQIFPNILWRLVFLATMCFISGCWQVVFFKLALKVEFGGKKERLRSL